MFLFSFRLFSFNYCNCHQLFAKIIICNQCKCMCKYFMQIYSSYEQQSLAVNDIFPACHIFPPVPSDEENDSCCYVEETTETETDNQEDDDNELQFGKMD